MEIRVATQADAESIKGLDEVASVDGHRRALIDGWLGRRECWVATLEGQVVGYAVFNYSFYERGFIEMLYVVRSCRRRGIGLALMRHCEGRCHTPGLFTSTNQSNVSMQRLLAQAGFEPSGRIDNLDDADAEIVYFKRLKKTAG